MSKKIIFSLLFSAVSLMALHAQEFTATALYTAKTNTDEISVGIKSNKTITPEMQQKIEEKMKTLFDKNFILHFNKTASTYKLEEKPQSNGQQRGSTMRMASAILDGGTFYKNSKDKFFAVDKKIMDKEYLVKDALAELPWKLQNETKMIAGYNCHKATAVRKPGVTDFRHFKSKNTGVQQNPANKNKKTSILDMVDIPAEIMITAWYAPEIPFKQGPEIYWGLPGLILEINDGKTTTTCSKMTLNTTDKAAIEAPVNGMPISQQQYESLLLKKLNELQENYLNQGSIKK